jgi:hypothetical protein
MSVAMAAFRLATTRDFDDPTVATVRYPATQAFS